MGKGGEKPDKLKWNKQLFVRSEIRKKGNLLQRIFNKFKLIKQPYNLQVKKKCVFSSFPN